MALWSCRLVTYQSYAWEVGDHEDDHDGEEEEGVVGLARLGLGLLLLLLLLLLVVAVVYEVPGLRLAAVPARARRVLVEAVVAPLLLLLVPGRLGGRGGCGGRQGHGRRLKLVRGLLHNSKSYILLSVSFAAFGNRNPSNLFDGQVVLFLAHILANGGLSRTLICRFFAHVAFFCLPPAKSAKLESAG